MMLILIKENIPIMKFVISRYDEDNMYLLYEDNDDNCYDDKQKYITIFIAINITGSSIWRVKITLNQWWTKLQL
jgi:hypothetical protein